LLKKMGLHQRKTKGENWQLCPVSRFPGSFEHDAAVATLC